MKQKKNSMFVDFKMNTKSPFMNTKPFIFGDTDGDGVPDNRYKNGKIVPWDCQPFNPEAQDLKSFVKKTKKVAKKAKKAIGTFVKKEEKARKAFVKEYKPKVQKYVKERKDRLEDIRAREREERQQRWAEEDEKKYERDMLKRQRALELQEIKRQEELAYEEEYARQSARAKARQNVVRQPVEYATTESGREVARVSIFSDGRVEQNTPQEMEEDEFEDEEGIEEQPKKKAYYDIWLGKWVELE
jgi:hypothetical protein